MDFNSDNKVIIDSMDRTEAKAFIKFLESKILRHQKDIQQADGLIMEVKVKFDLAERELEFM